MNHVYILRDKLKPGNYQLAVQTDEEKRSGSSEATVLPWRGARAALEVDSFIHACRVTFADWCKVHGL